MIMNATVLPRGRWARFSGWGAVTLSRYENGALQAEAHEKAFRLAMESHNLLRLLEETSEGDIAEDKKARIVRDLKALEEEACTLKRIFCDPSPVITSSSVTGKGDESATSSPDWLLIYKIEEGRVIFERTGTHLDLFRK